MDIHLRREDEMDAWVDLLNEDDPAPQSVADVVRMEAAPPGDDRARPKLSATRGGDLVGLALAYPAFGGPRGWYSALVKVAPAQRGHGLGDRLVAALQDAIGDPRPPGLQTKVGDDDPGSRAWAEARGFSLWAHRFQSTLDVATADTSELPALEARAAAAGYRVIQPTPDDDRRLYDLDVRLVMDAPDLEGGEPPSWELFQHSRRTLVDRDGTFVAERGGEWVGFTELFVSGDRDRYTAFTGVEREHRGSGLARLLKLRTIAYCKEAGIEVMRTNNLSVNEPMLAVNRRLGYRPEPGVWLMRRPSSSPGAV